MLFNSYTYILLFLPITVIGYFLLNRRHYVIASKAWLVLSSLFFYGWWNIKYVPLICCSVVINYATGSLIVRQKDSKRKAVLLSGILFNVILLGYFKYVNFIVDNVAWLTHIQISRVNVILPLGISFFTFTQIAYLVDSYNSKAHEYDFMNYSLFVTFFPHLLAGPIIHHKEMMPQFGRLRGKVVDYRNISLGVFLFFVGLFKKVMIADTFAAPANLGFNHVQTLTMLEAWMTTLSYTLQIYFDFSGYTDMALGAAMMFNIRLPINFDAPYRARNIREFWQRWHITLSRFLRDYIYIPTGGNRNGTLATCRNLLVTFLIGGIWHGAGWTFIAWGLLHGAAIVVHRLWTKTDLRIHALVAWFLTFNFVNATWVFFRAGSLPDAVKVLKAMAGLNGIILPRFLERFAGFLTSYGITFNDALLNMQFAMPLAVGLVAGLLVSVAGKTSDQMASSFEPTWKTALMTGVVGMASLLNLTKVTEFLYFQF